MGRKIGRIILVLGFIFLLNNMCSQAEEIIKPYQVKCEQPNGENNYYTEAPNVEIVHADSTFVTKYKMNFPDGKELTGTLTKNKKTALIPSELFLEGQHHLEVWMENSAGEMVAGTKMEKRFKIDRIQPKEPLEFIYPKGEAEQVLCLSEETEIEIKAEDATSGIKGIYYRLNEQEEQFVEGECIRVKVPLGFEGHIIAYAVDQAGNVGREFQSKDLICEAEAPEIQLQVPRGFESWYNQQVEISVNIQEHGIQSGIRQVTCYVNGKKAAEKSCELQTLGMVCSFSVNGMSTVIVEAEDYAGNRSVERKQILYDSQKPNIEIEGAEHYMITGSPVSLSCSVSDDQRVTYLLGKVSWKDTLGTEHVREITNWKKDGELYRGLEILEEDGIYKVQFQAQDQAGNQNEVQMQVIVDQGNPIISHVEQFQGKYLRQFQWKYKSEEVVEDFTSYTYAIYLDGRICEPDMKYEEEGKHLLEVTAKDAAENVSTAKAVFTIDRTEPEILFENIEEGKRYEKEVEAIVTLKEEKDRITHVYIDGVRQELGKTKQTFRYVFQEIGEHEMKVIARDLAGNTKEESICFTVKETNRIFDKIIGGKRMNRNVNENKQMQKERKGKLLLPGLVIVGAGMVIVGIKIKRRAKK